VSAAAAAPAPAPASVPGECRHCGLPTGDPGRAFCCYGCTLAYEVAGRGGEEGEATLILASVGTGAFLTMNVMAFSALLYTGEAASGGPLYSLFRWLQLGFATPAIALLGWPIAKNALAGPRRQGMDLLVLTGIVASFALSAEATIAGRGHVYYETAAVVLVLVTLGRYLEARARASASASLRSLLGLLPRQAAVLRAVAPGEAPVEVNVPVASIRAGDRVIVRPGEASPVDGEVVLGEAFVDAAVLTGESRPAALSPGARLFAGTIPRDGRLVVLAKETGEARLVARLARLLDEARRRRAPIERTADRVSAVFLGIAVAVAVASLLPPALAGDAGEGVRRALAVLVVACPCALGIATPLALWVGLVRAAREGALVRSAAGLEALAGTTTVLFDKTGTLTAGRPALVEVAVRPGGDGARDRALALAAGLEAASEHQVGRALVEAARARSLELPAVRRFRVRPGLGVEGELEGVEGAVLVGSPRLLERDGVPVDPAIAAARGRFEVEGRTVVLLAAGGRNLAAFALGEAPRPEAAEAVAALRGLGLEVAALTGDGAAAGAALGRALEIPVAASLLPDEKVAEVERRVRAGERVVMVGDGLNDAPALAAATVGIAVRAGTDLAREAAPISLLVDDLRAVPRLVALARAAARTIRWNLVWAFVYNVVGVGLAAFGRLSPALAALAMVASSAFVVGQSLRLGRRPREAARGS